MSMQGGKGETSLIYSLCYVIFDFMTFEFCEMDFMSVVILIFTYYQFFSDRNIKNNSRMVQYPQISQ